MSNKVIIGFCIFAVLFFVTNIAWASDDRKNTKIVVKPTISVPPPTIISRTVIERAIEKTKGVALASASGQHHYKATNQLQWSVGTAFSSGDSAVSFGLGKQVGKVFVSGGYSTDGDDSMMNVGASGTF